METTFKPLYLSACLIAAAFLFCPLTNVAAELSDLQKGAAQSARAETDIPALIAELKSKNEDARNNAISQLGEVGRAAIPALVEFANNEKSDARVYAAQALVLIEPKNKVALQTLADIVKNDKGNALIEAAETLIEIDPDSDLAVPSLVKLAEKTVIFPTGKNMLLPQRAAHALGMSEPGVRALTKLLQHWDSWVRRRAVFAFDDRTETLGYATTSIQVAVKEAIPALVSVLSDKDKVVREMAAEDLEQIGADALPALMKAVKGSNPKLSAAAAEVLAQIEKNKISSR